jgi:hypothetical protein
MAKVGVVRSRSVALIWIAAIEALLLALFAGTVTHIASASSRELDSTEYFPTLALQSTATPTATLQIGPTSEVSFSLAALGYDEVTLTSPYGQAQYSFTLPENWTVQTGSALDLDLSYAYHQTNATAYPALFGELTVALDGETVEIFPINEAEFDHYQLRVPLPAALLNSSNRTRRLIKLSLDAGLLCEVPHRARLVVHPTSSISLTYSQRPVVPDLARYPRPFYQQAFEPDSVRFVLPSQSTSDDLDNALAVAAKLGDLTGNRLVISATTDVDLRNLFSTPAAAFDEHLIVIGQPGDNQLLPLLNDVADLPVSLHQRQLDLIMQGPMAVAPGDVFTYVFTITNTLDRSVELSLVNPLPTYTELTGCTPDCTHDSDNHIVTWKGDLLAPNEAFNLSLALRATDLLTGTILENTITLVDADVGPINAGTLTASVVADSASGEFQVSAPKEGEYFFVYAGRAVARGDGIIQEILSPWSQYRAILILTGLSDEAVRKASQAMSSEAQFPGMNGTVALVRHVSAPSAAGDAGLTGVEMTFADLGYQSQVIQGGGSVKRVDYFFRMPYGWQLTDEAFVDLYFSHSRLIDYEDSGLTVLLNRRPIASAALSEKTADDGHLHISLAGTDVRPGQNNRLTLEVDASMPGMCVDNEQAWVLIKDTSKIFLAHREEVRLELDLDFFPYPFHLNPALTNLLLVLPDSPTVAEIEIALRLAAALGDSAAGKTILPVAMMSSDLPRQDLEDFQIIVLGRPSHNDLIQQVNTQLPQPFLPGFDEIEQRLDDVVFRLPQGVGLGYLQLIPSPWNERRAFLAVTGTTDESVNWAAKILTDEPWALNSGNLALIRDGDVNTIDTRELTHNGVAVVVATVVPEMTATTMTAITTTTSMSSPLPLSPTSSLSEVERVSNQASRPVWLIPLLGVNGLVVIAIFTFVFWQARRPDR